MIYRSAGFVWKYRAALVEVDGTPVGRLRSGDRLRLDLSGVHSVSAHIGNTWTPPVTVDLDPATEEPTILALRASMPDRSSSSATAGPLKLVRTSAFDDRGMTLSDAVGNRPLVGYRRRSPREQVLWFVAVVLIFGGELIAHTISRAVGLPPVFVGAIVIVVLLFRVALYRRPNGDRSQTD